MPKLRLRTCNTIFREIALELRGPWFAKHARAALANAPGFATVRSLRQTLSLVTDPAMEAWSVTKADRQVG
jgi:hypothetical protein